MADELKINATGPRTLVFDLGVSGEAYGQFAFLHPDGALSLAEFGYNGRHTVTVKPEDAERLINAYQQFREQCREQQAAQQMEAHMRSAMANSTEPQDVAAVG